MATNKFAETNMLASIDTFSIRTYEQSAISQKDAPYINKSYTMNTNNNQENKTWYVLNPNTYCGRDTYSFIEQSDSINNMLVEMHISNYDFNRVDLRFDFFDESYERLFKLNRAFTSIYKGQHSRTKSQNFIYTDGDIPSKLLSCKVSSTRYQIEYYDKKTQEPKGNVLSRLECRSIRLEDGDTLVNIIDRWKKNILNVPNGFDSLICESSNKITEAYYQLGEEGKVIKPSEFLWKNDSHIYTNQQIVDVFNMAGYADAIAAARRYRQDKQVSVITERELQDYCQILTKAIDRYMES